MARDYEQQISAYTYADVRDLWTAVRNADPLPDWDAGKAFEYLILRAFQLEGAEVVWPYSVELESEIVEQIDGVVYSDNLTCLVEAKDYRDNVAIGPVAKLRNQLARRPPSVIGLLFSRTDFTSPARIVARHTNPQRILFWQHQDISIALENERMRRVLELKFRYAVEFGLPDLILEDHLL